jgi:hypothetical protein
MALTRGHNFKRIEYDTVSFGFKEYELKNEEDEKDYEILSIILKSQFRQKRSLKYWFTRNFDEKCFFVEIICIFAPSSVNKTDDAKVLNKQDKRL